jgi:hypothetical protein
LLVVVAQHPLPGQIMFDPHPLSRNELGFYAGGGLTSLRYDSPIGSAVGMVGGLLGADYQSYFFGQRLGFSIGLEVAYHSAKGVIGDYADAKDGVESYGKYVDSTVLRNYTERQTVTMVNIPLMLRFRGNQQKSHPYMAVGVKIGVPVLGKYRVEEGSVAYTSKWVEHENYTYIKQEGLGSFVDIGVDRRLGFHMAFLLSAEVGVNWRLKKTLLLHTGLYVDYGLNNVVEKDDKPAFDSSQSPAGFRGSMLTATTGDVLPMAIGFKVGITLRHTKEWHSDCGCQVPSPKHGRSW